MAPKPICCERLAAACCGSAQPALVLHRSQLLTTATATSSAVLPPPDSAPVHAALRSEVAEQPSAAPSPATLAATATLIGCGLLRPSGCRCAHTVRPLPPARTVPSRLSHLVVPLPPAPGVLRQSWAGSGVTATLTLRLPTSPLATTRSAIAFSSGESVALTSRARPPWQLSEARTSAVASSCVAAKPQPTSAGLAISTAPSAMRRGKTSSAQTPLRL
mmetsp:Transcript_37273/g.87147  ORF Transcript_37273/g.87147 Transcript_37273/m.87147 type:complete len:218 (+) Transcript_37273:145-798(+)